MVTKHQFSGLRLIVVAGLAANFEANRPFQPGSRGVRRSRPVPGPTQPLNASNPGRPAHRHQPGQPSPTARLSRRRPGGGLPGSLRDRPRDRRPAGRELARQSARRARWPRGRLLTTTSSSVPVLPAIDSTNSDPRRPVEAGSARAPGLPVGQPLGRPLGCPLIVGNRVGEVGICERPAHRPKSPTVEASQTPYDSIIIFRLVVGGAGQARRTSVGAGSATVRRRGDR